MKQTYLQVTYRDGRPYLAYLNLASERGEKSDKCRRVEPGMVLDIDKNGKLIGIELLNPDDVTLEATNALLEEYAMEPLEESHLAPILTPQKA